MLNNPRTVATAFLPPFRRGCVAVSSPPEPLRPATPAGGGRKARKSVATEGLTDPPRRLREVQKGAQARLPLTVLDS